MWHPFSFLRDWLFAVRAPRKPRTFRAAVELLEDRLCPSAGLREQYMLELLNRMRTNPAAELPILLNSNDADVNSALTYFNVNRSVLQSQWNTLVPAPALAWNDNLAGSALYHDSQMFATGQQSHQVAGEPDLGSRATLYGYNNWSFVGENIFAYATSVFQAHAAFAIDWGNTSTGIQSPPGHRENIMDPGFRDVGVAFLDDPSQANNVGPLLVTQDFGNRYGYGNPFLVGAVFNDSTVNGYYDQGEGLAGVTLTITGAGGTTTTSTTNYGGYQIQLSPGTYTVTASGGSLAAPVTKTVVIGSTNVHVNFIRGELPHLDATLPFSDDFTRSDSSFIGAYWTPVQGNFSIVNNTAVATDPGISLTTVNGLSVTDVAVQANITASANQVAGLVARSQTDGSFYVGSVVADASGTNFTPYLFKYTKSAGFTRLDVAAPTVPAGAGVLRLEAVGSSLKLFFGSTLVTYAFDSTLTGGTTGLRASSGAIIDNFTTTAIARTTPTLPFTDAFALADGSPLTRNWVEQKGNFSIVGGTARGNDADGSVATLNGVSVTDVAVQANVSLGPNLAAGLIARYQANGSYYLGAVQADASGANLTPYLFEYVAGKGFIQLGGNFAKIPVGGALRLEVVGSSLKLFVGASLVAFASDSDLTAAGSTGIRAHKNATLDNFTTSVITLTSPTLPFTDTFTQTDGSQLSRNWAERQGNFTVVGGAIVGNDSAGLSVATLNGVSVADVAVQANVNAAASLAVGVIARYQANGSYYLGIIESDRTGANYTPYIFSYVPGKGFVQLNTAPTTFAAGPGVLRFEVIGVSLKLYFGSATVAYAIDSTITAAGTTGVRASKGATLDNVATSVITLTSPTLPFTDTFTQTDGSQLSRNWSERQGNFSVLGGTLRANDAGINLATLNGPAVADTTVQANVSIAANQAVGLVGRYQANGSFYFGAIVADNTGTNCTAYIFAYIAGLGYFQINTAAPSIAGTNGVLRFQLVGSSLRLYFGADTAHLTLIASTQDTTIAAAGVVGVRTTKNVVIDNFTAG